MTDNNNAPKTDLGRLLVDLGSPNRNVRLAAIRCVAHVHQRPDLATVDALLEVSHQLSRLAEAYEIVNAVEPRRAALEKEREMWRLKGVSEERARHPPSAPPRVAMEDSYEYNDCDLSVRAYNALTRGGGEFHTKEEILDMDLARIKNFGRSSYVDLIKSLRRNQTAIHTIRRSTLWNSAPVTWRTAAEKSFEPPKQKSAEVTPVSEAPGEEVQ